MPPKSPKRFNNGHKPPSNEEQGFLREVYNKETYYRDKFNLARSQSLTEAELSSKPQRDTALHDFLTDVARVEALKRRKEIVNAELAHMKEILRHKQICISAGGTMTTLHPALAQASTVNNLATK